MTAIIVIVVVVILAAWLVSMYNSLVKMRNNRENAFAEARYDTAKLPPDRSAKAAVYARIDIKEYPRLCFLLRR